MQELAVEAVAAGVPVARVAGDRVADRREVGADLVRAPGLEPGLHQGVGRAASRARGSGCAPRARRAHAPPDAPGRGGRGRAGRRSSRCASAAGPRSARGTCAPRSRSLIIADEPAMRLVVAGDEHQAGGVLVEPVDDPRPVGLPAAEQLAERVDERRSPVPARRVNDQPGGLVDDRQPLVGDRRPAAARSRQRPQTSASPHGSPAAATPSGSTIPRRRSARGRRRRAVIATSATLNAGHSGGSMKSVTAPSRIRSTRLPSAPPASRPTPSHSRGPRGSMANQPRTSASAPARDREHDRVAAVARAARRRCRCSSPESGRTRGQVACSRQPTAPRRPPPSTPGRPRPLRRATASIRSQRARAPGAHPLIRLTTIPPTDRAGRGSRRSG